MNIILHPIFFRLAASDKSPRGFKYRSKAAKSYTHGLINKNTGCLFISKSTLLKKHYLIFF